MLLLSEIDLEPDRFRSRGDGRCRGQDEALIHVLHTCSLFRTPYRLRPTESKSLPHILKLALGITQTIMPFVQAAEDFDHVADNTFFSGSILHKISLVFTLHSSRP